ncbi:MAG: IPT/TIG domain-containing protein [Verrucomicrobiota bacterium]
MNFLRRVLQTFFLLSVVGAEGAFAQSVTGFSPAFGTTNDAVVISGSGFTGVTNVIFNTQSVRVTPTADTQIIALVPAGATTGPIKVVKGVNQAVTPTNFTVIGREPYITDFSPISGAAGTVVTMNGVHFTSVTNARFAGINATIAPITSDTQIQVTAPVNVVTGPISLTRSNVTGTTSSNFFVAPTITSFSPTSGRAGTNVIIIGKNLTGTTGVKFNGASASYIVDSNTQITATVPLGASTGFLNVIAPGGQFITTSNFVVLPTITGFNPSIGRAGTNVIITGFNLNGTTNVYFNGASAIFSGVTSNQLTAVVPVAATSGPIKVATTNGIFISTSNFFLPPGIITLSPTTGAPGTNVTITGINFTNATVVSFNAVSATFSVVNNTSIIATVPVGATSGSVSVSAPAGTANSTNIFYLRPIVSGFSPGGGVAGSTITITGSSFTNVTAVQFNGFNASFSLGNNSQLTALVPAGATTGPISVTAPGGTAVSAANFVVDSVSLSIRLLTNRAVAISWTTNALGFALQANNNLVNTNGWMAVTNSPAVVNGKNTVTNNATNMVTFYRLRK